MNTIKELRSLKPVLQKSKVINFHHFQKCQFIQWGVTESVYLLSTPLELMRPHFFPLLLKSDPRAKRSCIDEILFQCGCFKILCGVRILPPAPQRAPCSCVLRGQGQHLTGFYWFIVLLCSTDCCDTMANFRNMSPASSEAVLLWNIRMAKANICIRRAEGSSPHFTPQPSIHWFGGGKKKREACSFLDQLQQTGAGTYACLKGEEGERPLRRHHTKKANLLRKAWNDLNTPLY